MRRTYKSALVAIALGFVAASCGEATTATGNVNTVSVNEEGGESVGGQPKGFGDEVVDLATGETVTIGDIVTGDRPVLVWSFAPHCGTCRAEAPVIDAFAKANEDKVQVIGIGATDTVEYAQDFKASTQVESSILWSQTSAIWGEDKLNLQSFPRYKVYSQDLTLESDSQFGFNEISVLQTIEQMTA